MWHWEAAREKEWQDIKYILSTKPVLDFFDPVLDTMHQRMAMGQLHKKEWKPVAYGDRGLTGCEKRYAQIEKEIAYGC